MHHIASVTDDQKSKEQVLPLKCLTSPPTTINYGPPYNASPYHDLWCIFRCSFSEQHLSAMICIQRHLEQKVKGCNLKTSLEAQATFTVPVVWSINWTFHQFAPWLPMQQDACCWCTGSRILTQDAKCTLHIGSRCRYSLQIAVGANVFLLCVL